MSRNLVPEVEKTSILREIPRATLRKAFHDGRKQLQSHSYPLKMINVRFSCSIIRT